MNHQAINMANQPQSGVYFQKYNNKVNRLLLEKPIDIILCHNFLNGEVKLPKNALEVYDAEIKAEDDRRNFQDLKGHFNHKKQYECQRKLRPEDGLLYYYSKNKGKVEVKKDGKPDEKEKEKIQMLVCVTMYNEDYSLLERTLGGVQQNLKGFEELGITQEQIVVVVIQDGIQKANANIVSNIFDKIDKELGLADDEAYQLEKLYDEDTLKQKPGGDVPYQGVRQSEFLDQKLNAKDQIRLFRNHIGDDEEADRQIKILKSRTYRARVKQIQKATGIIGQKYKTHIKEYTSQNSNFPINIPKNIAQVYQTKYDVLNDGKSKPLTVFFVNKHLNGRKLSSHMWFFQGFCRQLKPKYLSLIDCGTQPDENGLVEYYKSLESDSSIGGVSGFMSLYFNDELEGNLEELKKRRDDYLKEIENNKLALLSDEDRRQYLELKKQNNGKDILDNNNTTEDYGEKFKLLEEEIKKKELELEERKKASFVKRYCENSIWKNYIKSSCRLESSKDHVVRQETKEQQQKDDDIFYEKQQKLYNECKKKKNQNTESEILHHEEKKVKKGCCSKNPLRTIADLITERIFKFFIWVHLFFDIRKAQIYEYDSSHILDKNFESFFNFLQVLPGAWSAYRYEALIKAESFKQNILESKYLIEMLNPGGNNLNLEESNMYLAEDRILCLAMFSQKNFNYILKYIPTAKAKTDAIDNNIEFMLQRRRWINSSWFAQNYVLRNYTEHMKDSTHWFMRKYIGIPFMMFMSYLNQVNAYLMVGFYSFVLHSCISIFNPLIIDEGLPDVLLMLPASLLILYVLLVILIVFLSLNYKINKANDNYKLYAFVSGLFGVYNLLVVGLVFVSLTMKYVLKKDFLLSEKQKANQDQNDDMQLFVIIMAVISLGAVAIMIVVQVFEFSMKSIKQILGMVLSVPSYLYFTATYTHTLLIYAFCNIDDFSWGTKGSTESKKEEDFINTKNVFIAKWMFANSLCCYVLIGFNQFLGEDRGYVILALGAYGALILALKFIFAFIHHFNFYLIKRPRTYFTLKKKKNLYGLMGEKVKKEFSESNIEKQRKKKEDQQIQNQNQSKVLLQKYPIKGDNNKPSAFQKYQVKVPTVDEARQIDHQGNLLPQQQQNQKLIKELSPRYDEEEEQQQVDEHQSLQKSQQQLEGSIVRKLQPQTNSDVQQKSKFNKNNQDAQQNELQGINLQIQNPFQK